MEYPNNLKYNKEHVWVKIEGDLAYIGVTEYAQEKLGEVLFVELPEVEDEISKGEEFSVVESSKKASSILAPISGEVVEINERLDDEPEYVNEAAYDAWIAKVKISDESELEDLIDASSYESGLE